MKKISFMLVLCLLALNLNAFAPKDPNKADNRPYYQGQVVEVHHGGAYTYMLVKENNDKDFWVVVENSDVNKGDFVRFKNELIAKNFSSKDLNRTFDEIMFADSLQYRVKK